jgi:hypothetical protein
MRLRFKVRHIAIVALAFAVSVAPAAAQPTARELATEMANVNAAAKAAEVFAAGLPEGAVKDAAQARVVSLQITHDMLQQRALALRFNIALNYSLNGDPSTPKVPSAALINEIRSIEQRILSLQKGAADGDVLKQIELGSLAVTLAGLQQRALFDRFGIPMMSAVHAPTQGVTSRHPAPSQPAAAPQFTPPADPSPRLTMVSVDFKATERNSTFVRYGWKIQVSNNTSSPVRFDAILQFQDADQFVVDTKNEYGLTLGPNEMRDFTGDALIRANPAASVRRLSGELKIR